MVNTQNKAFTFNKGQEDAIAGLDQCLKRNGVYGLLGGAGTGKTTVFQQVLQNYINTNRERILEYQDRMYEMGIADSPSDLNIVICAPTNKAVKVARRMATEKGINTSNLEYKTIYSLLGLQVDEQEGKKNLKRSDRDNDVAPSLIIIDEASMVNTEIKNELGNRFIGECPILVVGDPFQLPPVGEQNSPMFADLEQKFQLTETMRQGDSPAGFMVDFCRDGVINKWANFDPRMYGEKILQSPDSKKGTWFLHESDWQAILIPAYKQAKKTGNWDKTRVIAYHHKTIQELNKYVRYCLFGEIADDIPYLEGEPLICLSPVKRMMWDERKCKLVDSIICPTATELIVVSATKSLDTKIINNQSYTYPCWMVLAEDIDSHAVHELKMLDPIVQKAWKEDCEALKQQAIEAAKLGNKTLWRHYYELNSFFDDVRVGYGLTVYPSQGSTFETVFIPGNDIMAVRAHDVRNRSWYVACSRASKKIILC